MSNVISSFSEEQIDQFLSLWGKLPDPMPAMVFNTVSKRLPSTAIETVVLRVQNGTKEVLLAQRSQNDVYPGQWHSFGTLLRESDATHAPETPGTFDIAFERLQQDKFKARFSDAPKLVTAIPFHSVRGLITCLIFRCKIDGEPPIGQYFPVDALPQPIVASHPFIIKEASEAFNP